MKITALPTGFFKLDGGAMFGIVPKRLWQRLTTPDENNLCTWAMRCLLIESGSQKILVDCGLGDKQDAKWRSYFLPFGDDTLTGSLAAHGISPEDITDVFLTHLHFDHCGGAVKFNEAGRLVPTFPNAIYWSNEVQWSWAMNPNEREKASFLQENFVPLKDAGVLQFIDVQKDPVAWLPGMQVQYAYGHTEAMMALHIDAKAGHFVYCADLMPSSFHLGMPYVMGYDIRPLVTLAEKEWLLSHAVEGDWTLIFEHDPDGGFGKLMRDERGRIVLKEKFDL
ncbi:MAG: MBL fold metallo-hydrolase [Saprospiraceae bacterium]|nr:MAG: MBL fold metallo-hydrolase [Saprospiraceae bacterium]